jgi:hypothetical protein
MRKMLAFAQDFYLAHARHSKEASAFSDYVSRYASRNQSKSEKERAR